MKNFQNYERAIHTDVEESLSKIVNKISPNSVVLDVGCGPGMLGSYLSEVKGCTVDGVDSDAAAIEICRSKYRVTAVRNLESELLTNVFQTGEYDYIVVADVLEHLANPDQLLSELKKLVKPHGTIIFSVPNITHIAVGFELLFGYFEYSDNGLFDNTHLRFYSRQSLLNKLEAFGLYAWEVDTVQKEIEETEFSNHISRLFPVHWTNALVASREDALTYQWLLSTKIYPNDVQEKIEPGLLCTRNPPLLFTTELYWADRDSPCLTENRKLVGHLISKNEDSTIIDFHFSECGDFNGLQQIRIDPVSEKKHFLIVNAEILTAEENVVWRGQPQVDDGEVHGARLIVFVDSVGCLFQATNNDPQWLPSIDKKILDQVTDGWIFRLTLKSDDALFYVGNKKLIDQSQSYENILTERDRKIAIFQQRQNELQVLYNELHNENRAYRLSTSWRITRPLRQISQLRRQARRFIQLYQSHRQAHPGVNGFWRLVRRGVDIARKGDLSKGLQTSVAMYERSLSTALQAPSSSVLVLNDITDKTVKLPKNIAVHAHIYYPDLTTEIRSYLENIPVKFKLYITTDTKEKAKLVTAAFSKMKNMLALDIRIVENRGRDIFPMLVTLGAELAKHEIVLHIHTKRSPHNTWELGGWRRYLMESLLGSAPRVTAILDQFVKNKDLGILFPDPYHPVKRLVHMRTGANSYNIEKLLNRAGTVKAEMGEIDLNYFPAGNMFWFRGEAIKSLVGMKLSGKDFEPEEGQVDATLAHAIERMFPYFAGKMGLITKSYLPDSFLSQQCSAHRIDLFHTYLEKRLILNPTIIFDHNGGGGSNSYTRELVKSILADGGSALRVYCFDAIWFVQWIGDGDGMLFYTSSIEELFESLSVSRGTSVVLNSLYGYPDIKIAASNIVGLAQSLSATLDFKIHDFYALCSSPHLSNFEGKYCDVPQDPAVCGRCLKKNVGWYHDWYPKENRPVDIAEWRKPFAELFEAANTVTFFDPSSVEIVRKAFYLEDSKVKVIPHAIDYFKCDTPSDVTGPLHIGILGTLSHTKGANVIKELYDYIEEQGSHIPITLVGPSFVDTPIRVKVLGSYTPNELPLIIDRQGINVVLMPSIVPETFSYTISEAMKMGLPIVAFDIGAQGNRVKQYQFGKVVPLGSSPELMLSTIQSALVAAQEFRK